MSREAKRVLAALLQGAVLKAHRDLDGVKAHKLHFSETAQEAVIEDQVINSLWQRGLISSNMKFPVATYMLTEAGRQYSTRTLLVPSELKGTESARRS
ncbi:MAG: hypothetical protein U0175_39115 [Caldilineaceae bacterium]